MRARAEELKEELIDHPAVREWSAHGVGRHQGDACWPTPTTPTPTLRRRIEAGAPPSASGCATTRRSRPRSTAWIASTAVEARRAVEGRGRRGDRLDRRPLGRRPSATDRIELQVGRDLQFIRINGTVVGGLAGLVIYTVGQLIG